MANVVTITAYSPKTWTNGVDAANKTNLEHLETQAGIALKGFNGDFMGPFVQTGMLCGVNVPTASQLDVTAGRAYLVLSNGDVGRFDATASTAGQFTTSTPSTTYYLFLKNDGTYQWSTSASQPTNSIQLCSATTDGSGNMSSVTEPAGMRTAVVLPGNVMGMSSIGSINGQATVGQFGFPPIVKVVSSQTVSSTSPVTVNFAVSTNGSFPALYLLLASFYIGRAGTSTITLAVQYNRGDDSANTSSYQLQLQGGSVINALGIAGAGQWTCIPAVVYAASGHNITITYTDATATVADKLTLALVRII